MQFGLEEEEVWSEERDRTDWLTAGGYDRCGKTEHAQYDSHRDGGMAMPAERRDFATVSEI